MRLRDLGFLGIGVGAGLLVYGALVESKNLVIERRTLRLKGWPESKRGFKIVVLADMHIRGEQSLELAMRAIYTAIAELPDIIVLPGDLVGFWSEETVRHLGEALEPLLVMDGDVIATPGNREYWEGDPEIMRPICEDLGIKLLRNECLVHKGVQWVGVDSVNMRKADPFSAMVQADPSAPEPIIALWHEPDLVEWLPSGAALMISGHTHGGQFRLPNGWAPVHTKNGKLFVEGFYPDAPTPLYVSRGIGTTGPPSRLNCPPEVSVLTLEPLD
jgi:predicted MPP superfamily phosphohydrolase